MEEELIRITVSESIDEVKNFQKNFNPEGLCIYFSTNIGSLLDEQEISYQRHNIGEYIDTDYYHEFIITNPNEQGIAFLIDPAYSQFTEKKEVLTKFKQWPLNVLKSTGKGNIIASELIKNGLCKVNEQDIKLYLASFDMLVNPEEINFHFDNKKSRQI